MKTILQKISSFTLCIILVCSIVPVQTYASHEIPGLWQVQTDSSTTGIVKTLDYSYARNTYFSLRDIAMVLQNTSKSFSVSITKNAVSLTLDNSYTPVGTENTPWETTESPNLSLRRNEFTVNGQKISYYTLMMPLPSGDYDCFMMAADFAMILDVDISVPTGVSDQNAVDAIKIARLFHFMSLLLLWKSLAIFMASTAFWSETPPPENSTINISQMLLTRLQAPPSS